MSDKTIIASTRSIRETSTNPITTEVLRHGVDDIRSELSGPGEQALAPIEPKLETLDEIASMLIQIDPADKKGFSTARDALKELAEREGSASIRKTLIKAAREANRIATGRDSDPNATIVLIGNLIDQANSPAAEIEETALPMPVPERVKKPEPAARQFPDPSLSVKYQCDVLASDSDLSLVGEFITESREMLEEAESALLALESDLEDIENVNIVFRAFHTIKGTAAYLGLARLAELAHHAESLLSRMRDREIQCSGGYADLALRSLDTLKHMLDSIDGFPVVTPIKLPVDYGELRRVLENPEANGVSGKPFETSIIDGPDGEVEDHAIPIGEILGDMGKVTIEQIKTILDTKGSRLTGEALIRDGLVTLEDVTEALNKQKAADARRDAAAAESSVRVRTDRLDRLIDLVGELVIAQSMLAQDSTVMQGTYHELTRKISHAGKIVRDLQDLSMGMRMVPLRATFQKMSRLVRDLGNKTGKQVEFITAGDETEIDRNMVDLVADPLVHMVRNAIDHGIETPHERQSLTKSPTGKVRLSAYHAGGDVMVELTDDGAGLDRDKLVAKAISNNLIESDKGMSENEIFRLIFAPGFSTAEEVTDFSGRGVGMDVVRRNIEALRGRIEISSEKGKGSVFTIRLPLTLAITDGMLISVGSERYIVPTVNIHLSFRPNQQMLSSVAGRGELVSLRGELMPIFRLHQLFGVKGAAEDPTKGLLMIVADGRRRCALMVDELLGQQQVVTKTLGEGVGKIPGVSGGAILGDGCVSLILDTAEIVALSRQTPGAHGRKTELRNQPLNN